MTRLGVVVGTVVCVLASFAGVQSPATAAAPIVDQASPLSGWDPTGSSLWASSTSSIAQVFVAQTSGTLTSVKLPLNRYSDTSPATNFTISLFDSVAYRPTGAALGSVTFLNDLSTPSTMQPSALKTGRANPPSYVEATFSTAIPVTAGSQYAIVLTTSDVGYSYMWFIGDHTYCVPDALSMNPSAPTPSWNVAVPQYSWPLSFWTYVDGTAVLSAPTDLVATSSKNARVPISFRHCTPASVPITDYEYSIGSSGIWLSTGQREAPVTVAGLTNGTTYDFLLRARYGVTGTGPASASVTATPNAERPDAPWWLGATPDDRGAVIEFTGRPDNGSALTNYEYEIDGSGTWIPLNPADTNSPVSITGLTNGVTYTLRLRAKNAIGVSDSSSPTNVTAGVPGIPGPLEVTAGDGSATLSFTPSSDNGSPVSNYEYDSGSGWTAFSPSVATPPVSITGLTNGTDVYIAIRAVNVYGAGQPQGIWMRPGVPDAPAIVTATPGASQVTLAITPCWAGSDRITNYEVDTGSGWTPFSPAATSSPLLVTGLSDGSAITIGLRAVNASGAGPASSVVVTPGVGEPTVTGSPSACARPADSNDASDNSSSEGTSSSGAAGGATPSVGLPISPGPGSATAQVPPLSDSSRRLVCSVTPNSGGNVSVAPVPVKAVSSRAATRARRATVRLGSPWCAMVSGMPARKHLTIEVWSAKGWLPHGTVTSNRFGHARTPVSTTTTPGEVIERIGSKALGWKYIRVWVTTSREQPSRPAHM